MMGTINGAMIMAPMIAGALSAIRPNVAMAAARPSMKKKAEEGTEPCRICRIKSAAGTESSSYAV